MATPLVYTTLDFTQPTSREVQWEGVFTIAFDGQVNSLRFITKNILVVVPEQGSTIDWFMGYLALPLAEAVQVKAGDKLKVSFSYLTGGSIRSLEKTMRATLSVTATN
jgi:hypothetical protein